MNTVYSMVSSMLANTVLADFVAIRIASINCIFVLLEEVVSEIGAWVWSILIVNDGDIINVILWRYRDYACFVQAESAEKCRESAEACNYLSILVFPEDKAFRKR